MSDSTNPPNTAPLQDHIDSLVDEFLILDKKMDENQIHSIIYARGQMKTQLTEYVHHRERIAYERGKLKGWTDRDNGKSYSDGLTKESE